MPKEIKEIKEVKEVKLNDSQKRAIGIATIIAIIFGGWMLKSFFILLVFAGVMAYLFNPMYRRLNNGKRGANKAAAWTLLMSILIVLLPVILVSLIAVAQLKSVSTDISDFVSTLDADTVSVNLADSVNEVLDQLPGNLAVTPEGLVDTFSQLVQAIGTYLVDIFTGVAGSIAGIVTGAILYIYVCFSFIKNGGKLVEMIKQLNPLGSQLSDVYFSRAGAMVRGTVQGQFVIALAQGFLAALTFALVGYPDLFFVLFIIFTAFSVIPLGAGILIIPIGIVMILTGNVTAGVIVIAQHLLINTNIDNVLRPILVPEEARLDSALMIISVFGAMGIWGFAGIIIGPTIMILIVTTIRAYLEVYRNYPTTEHKRFWHFNK